MAPSTLTLAFAAALLLSLAVKFWLATRQVRHVMAARSQVPAAFAPSVSLQAHQRAADYTVANTRFGLLSSAFGAAVLLAWTLLGGLDALNNLVRDAVLPQWGAMAYQLALLVCFAVISSAIDLPFEAYNTFRIEQQFGFNRMTLKMWLLDMVKGAAVGAAIGLPLATLILWIMGHSGGWWWLWA
jgi:STE24 endopeptidase